MQRRSFLQLATTAAAGAIVQQASSALEPVSPWQAPSIALPPGYSLSTWIDADHVIHAMIENSPGEFHTDAAFPRIQPGRRYKVRLMNATEFELPVHLPGKAELTRIEQAPVQSIITGKIRLQRYSVVEAVLPI